MITPIFSYWTCSFFARCYPLAAPLPGGLIHPQAVKPRASPFAASRTPVCWPFSWRPFYSFVRWQRRRRRQHSLLAHLATVTVDGLNGNLRSTARSIGIDAVSLQTPPPRPTPQQQLEGATFLTFVLVGDAAAVSTTTTTLLTTRFNAARPLWRTAV